MVVKLGTGILTSRSKQIDPAQVEQLVAQVAAQRGAGREVVVVSSGAVGAGMGALGLAKRPTDLSDLQACAAVGQSRLMSTYSELFARHNLPVAQVLLTHDDLEHRDRHLNARNTLVSLLEKGVVPIVNENDAVSYTELKFGDNDWLAALVACLLPADLLVVLTTVDGLVENFGKKNPRTLPIVETIDANIKKLAGGTLSATAIGGMEAKLRAAAMTARTGIPMVIASGKKKRVLANLLDGRDEGTFFVPRPGRLRGRKRRIAFFHHPKGSLWVDNGARDALRDKGKSLLPPGVARCNGNFAKGDVVRICDLDGTEFSRGISRFDADEIRARKLKGIEIVHRNDLVIL
ncbi:MAG: glutamate 5-kinase [Verrucomicrobiales bacterium]|nr:glutamate 5-kinase [Verrucomicrobiales bacterium]